MNVDGNLCGGARASKHAVPQSVAAQSATLILQERARVKALTEELDRPLNVHRWRKLAGTDPDSYELILKIHALQVMVKKK
jgi:hypothetical protein